MVGVGSCQWVEGSADNLVNLLLMLCLYRTYIYNTEIGPDFLQSRTGTCPLLIVYFCSEEVSYRSVTLLRLVLVVSTALLHAPQDALHALLLVVGGPVVALIARVLGDEQDDLAYVRPSDAAPALYGPQRAWDRLVEYGEVCSDTDCSSHENGGDCGGDGCDWDEYSYPPCSSGGYY